MQFEGMEKSRVSNNLYWPTSSNFYGPCSFSPGLLCIRKAWQEMSRYISKPATGFLSPTPVLLFLPHSTALSLTSTALLTAVTDTDSYTGVHARGQEGHQCQTLHEVLQMGLGPTVYTCWEGRGQRSASTLHVDWKWRRINIYSSHAINVPVSNWPLSLLYVLCRYNTLIQLICGMRVFFFIIWNFQLRVGRRHGCSQRIWNVGSAE